MKLAHSYTGAKPSINQFMAAADFPPRSASVNSQLCKHAFKKHEKSIQQWVVEKKNLLLFLFIAHISDK